VTTMPTQAQPSVSAQAVVFHRPKAGSSATEWEDGAGFDLGDPAAGRPARLMVVDGATEAYDAIRWVGQLVDSFLGREPQDGRPALTAAAMDRWFGVMQQRWLERAPAVFGSIFEERKFTQDGSFATLLGCELTDHDWTAVALGDAVLFHTRGDRLVTQFPPMAASDFGLDPDGVFTQPSQRMRMRARLGFGHGELAPGDRLYLASDALAAWIVTEAARDPAVWGRLAPFDHPHVFARFVDTERAARRLKNDDVTLLRVRLSSRPAAALLVCS